MGKAVRSSEQVTELTRYGAFETANGDVVVFDRQNPDAWISSTVTWSVEEIDPVS